MLNIVRCGYDKFEGIDQDLSNLRIDCVEGRRHDRAI